MSVSKTKVKCPKCSAKLKISEELRDKKIACPRCQYKFRLNFRVSESGMSSIIHADFETRENLSQSYSKSNNNHPGIQLPAKVAPTPSPNRQPPSTTNTASFSSESMTKSFSGSLSGSQDPKMTDWGKEHYTQRKQFRRNHAGLSRAQMYWLLRRRYQPLNQNDEILQSTGIFLCLMAFITSILPFFDLKFIDFATAGSIPAILSIGTAIIGMLMIVIAQRQNPVTALGFGIGLLLMFVVTYIAIYDFFKDENPFRKSVEKTVPEVVEPKELPEPKPPAPLPGNGQRHNIAPAPDGGMFGQPKINNRRPLRPSDIELPPDFDPADDRLENIGDPDPPAAANQNAPLEAIEQMPRSVEDADKQSELEQNEYHKVTRLRQISSKLKFETYFKGYPSTQEYEDKFEVVEIVGKTSSDGVARFLDTPVTGFDFEARGERLILQLVPAAGEPKFLSTIMSEEGLQLGGLVCHFGPRTHELRGVQARYQTRDGRLVDGKWGGQPVPIGGAAVELSSNNRPIYGFLLYIEKKRIVGVGLVTPKSSN